MSIKKLPKNLFLVGDNTPPNMYSGFDIWKQYCASTDDSITEGTLLLDFPRKQNRMFNAINPYQKYMSPSDVNYSMFHNEFQNFKFYSLTAEAFKQLYGTTSVSSFNSEDYAEFSMILDRKLPTYGDRFKTLSIGFATKADEDLKMRFTTEELTKIVELKERVRLAMAFTGNINTKLIVREGEELKFMSFLDLYNLIADVYNFENLDKIGVTTYRYNIRAGKTERDILGTLENLTPAEYCIQIRTGVYYKGTLKVSNSLDISSTDIVEFYNIQRRNSQGQPLEVKYLIKSEEFSPISQLFDENSLTELKSIYDEIITLFNNERFVKKLNVYSLGNEMEYISTTMRKTANKNYYRSKDYSDVLNNLAVLIHNTSFHSVTNHEFLVGLLSHLYHEETIYTQSNKESYDLTSVVGHFNTKLQVDVFSLACLIGTKEVHIAGMEKVLEHVRNMYLKTNTPFNKFGHFIIDSIIYGYNANNLSIMEPVKYLHNFPLQLLEECNKFLNYAFNNVEFFVGDKGRQSLFLHILIEENHDFGVYPPTEREGVLISSNPLD